MIVPHCARHHAALSKNDDDDAVEQAGYCRRCGARYDDHGGTCPICGEELVAIARGDA